MQTAVPAALIAPEHPLKFGPMRGAAPVKEVHKPCFGSATSESSSMECVGGKMPTSSAEHLRLLIGLLTLWLFCFVEKLDRAGIDRADKGEAAEALAGPMRLLIVPMYLTNG